MKNLTLLLTIIILSVAKTFAQIDFITTWNLNLNPPGSTPNAIGFYVEVAGNVNYSWTALPSGTSGNGVFATSGNITITGLPASNTIILSIQPTNLKRFIASQSFDKKRLININQWGTTIWTGNMQYAFYECSNLTVLATDVPNFGAVTNMKFMFSKCTSLVGIANINSWNVANVTDFGDMFSNSPLFNENLSAWSIHGYVNDMFSNSGMDCANYSATLIGWAANPTTSNNVFFRALGCSFGTNAVAARNSLLNNNNFQVFGDVANANACYLPTDYFITTWDLASGGSAPTTLTFDVGTSGTVNYSWTASPSGATGTGSFNGTNCTITGLPANDKITLSIEPTNFNRIYFNNGIDRNRLRLVNQWGTTAWASMANAFNGCTFLNITAGDVPNLSAVTNMSFMFNDCKFLFIPFNINAWNTANVTNMSGMFYGANNFNQNISAWNTNNVTKMSGMFQNAQRFNQNISTWNTANVTNMSDLFRNATAFNQNLGTWQLNTNVTLINMLDNCGMDCANYSATLHGWANNPSTPSNKTLGANGRTYGINAVVDYNTLTTTKGWTINGATAGNSACFSKNDFVTTWNLATPGTGANQLNLSIGGSGTTRYYSWVGLPSGTSGSGSFVSSNLSLNGLATNDVITLAIAPTNFNSIDCNALTDNKRLTNINQWGTTAWSTMYYAFDGCSNLNVTATDIPNLNGVNNMSGMFKGCNSLNGPANIGSWNVANVQHMENTFRNAIVFNQNIGNWNVANVTTMDNMFYGTTAFNQDISSWNVGGVYTMLGTFADATAFNQDVSNWNVSNLQLMFGLFSGATAFNQNLGNWKLNSNVYLGNMLDNCGMDCANYSATLQGWAANPLTPNGKNLGANGLKYGANVLAAHTLLTTTKGWTITGDSLLNITTVPTNTINTTCNTTGSIAFATIGVPDSTYSFNYTVNGIASSVIVNVVANAFMLDSLNAGVYNNFNINYLCSKTDTTPITLSLPANPSIATTATNVLYVNKGATGDGSSWTNALGEVADALYIAHNNAGNTINQIWVASGSYLPKYNVDFNYCTAATNNRTQTFLLKSGVAMYGGFMGNETLVTQANPNVNITLLSGDLGIANDSIDNAYHVVTAHNLTAPTLLEGVTISYGNTDTIYNNYLGISFGNNNGGGVFINNVSSNFTLQNCTFSYNNAFGSGGGIFSFNDSALVTNSKILNNSAQRGGGVSINTGALSIINTQVLNNVANDGGGIYNNGSGVFNRIILSNNNAINRGGGAVMQADCAIQNSVITGNNAYEGGGLFLYSNVTLNNNSIVANTSFSGGSGVFNDVKVATFLNCIIWGNNVMNFGTVNYTHCNVQGVTPTGTNINVNPNFTNQLNPIGTDGVWLTADDGLQLACGSACYNTGDSIGAPILDIVGNTIYALNKDMGAYESQINITAITPAFASIPGICAGSNFALPATSTNNITGTWLPAINTNNTTTYTFTPTAGQCVTSIPSTIAVTVNPLPTIAITTTDSALCLGQTANITATGADSYTWNTADSTAVIAVTPSINTSYTVNGIDSNGCQNNALITVTVKPLPTIAITTTDSVLCLGQTAYLTATGANSYTWNTTDSAAVIAVTPNNTTNYTVTGIDSNGCSKVASLNQLVSTCTGMETFVSEKSQVAIYPNPSNGVFTLQLNTDAKVIVTNTLGQQVFNSYLNAGTNTLNLNEANGVYFVKIMSSNKQTTHSLIINK
jgi:surface protein